MYFDITQQRTWPEYQAGSFQTINRATYYANSVGRRGEFIPKMYFLQQKGEEDYNQLTRREPFRASIEIYRFDFLVNKE